MGRMSARVLHCVAPPLLRLIHLLFEIAALMLAQCLFGGFAAGFDTLVEVVVIPIEIRVRAEIDFDDLAQPRLLPVEPRVILEQPNVVVADGRREQHAEIAKGVADIPRRIDLFEIHDLADPDLFDVFVVFDQILEVDGIDERAFAILGSVLEPDRFFDVRKCRASAERMRVDQLILPSEVHIAFKSEPIDDVIHAIEAAQDRTLAAHDGPMKPVILPV